jgi:SAM-dependent methyltransferase
VALLSGLDETGLTLRVRRRPGAGSALPLAADGSPVDVRTLWSGSASTRDPAYCAFLSDLSAAAKAGQVTLEFPPFETPVLQEPGAWNLIGDAAFAEEYPDAWDTLSESSPNYALKRFERRLYLSHLTSWLESLPNGADVLDVGGGIGRFSQEWLRRGYRTSLSEPNGGALALALGHLARQGGAFSLWQLAAESLTPFADERFHLVSAMEVLCYLSDPQRGFGEAARVLRRGGLFVASVESPVGSLEPGVKHSLDAIAAAQSVTEQAREGDLWVRYFTAERLRAACESAGLVVETIIGTHYLTDGPLHHAVDVDRLGDAEYEEGLIGVEHVLAGSTRWASAARAWLVVARKP